MEMFGIDTERANLDLLPLHAEELHCDVSTVLRGGIASLSNQAYEAAGRCSQSQIAETPQGPEMAWVLGEGKDGRVSVIACKEPES